MALPFKAPQVNLGPRSRKILRIVAYTFFALFVFVFALQLSFPYKRVTDKLIEASADKYDITIGGVDRGLMPGRIYLTNVNIATRPTKPGEQVQKFYINKLQLDIGILAIVGGKIALDFDATLGDHAVGYGHLKGGVSVAKFGAGDIKADITGETLPADALPMVGLIGLPMTGKLQFSVDLNLPVEKSKFGKSSVNWPKAAGEITLACPKGCTFGDGKTKLKPLLKNTRNQVMVGEGIEFGKVNLDTLAAKVSIKSGLLKVDKFDVRSKDGDLKVDFELKLEKNFDESMVTGCLRFKGSDDLLKREPRTHAAISTTGAELRPDGLFHIRLTDRFKDMKRLNQECGPNGQVGPANGDSSQPSHNDRPNLTVQPDDVAKPTAPTAPPPTTPTPEPPPAGSAVNPTGAAQPPGTNFEPATPNPPPATPRGERGAGFNSGEGKMEGAASGAGSAPTPPSE